MKILFGIMLLLAGTLHLSAFPDGGGLYSIDEPTETKTDISLFDSTDPNDPNYDPNLDPNANGLGGRESSEPVADALPYLVVVALGYGFIAARRKKTLCNN
jgi:hypothetical protein